MMNIRAGSKSTCNTILCLVAGLAWGCGGSETTGKAADTLADEMWPGETFSSQAGATKAVLMGSLESGELATAGTELFAADFRGESFDQRELGPERIESGVSLREWASKPADLGAADFLSDWQAFLETAVEVSSFEAHTWEIEVLEIDGRDAVETTEAIWWLTTMEDGRTREERFYLVLEMVRDESSGSWLLRRARAEGGRSSVAAGPYFRDVTHQVLPAGYDQIGAQIYTDGGPTLEDFDGDGDIDLVVPRLHAPLLLYENEGQGYFSDRTARRGLAVGHLAQGTNSALIVDLDGDGFEDLVVASKLHGVMVFLFDGDRFVEQADPLTGAGEWESLAAADYDGDGLVDLFAANYGFIDADHQPASYVDARDGMPNALLRNLGDGRFVDTTLTAGLDTERWTYAASWADYDRDGDMDLLVANDYGPKALYRNRGDGRFDEVAAEVGAQDLGNGMGVSWADLDGDLWLDAYFSNMQSFAGNRITRLENFPGTAEQRELYARFSRGNTFLRNLGDGSFEDLTDESGLRGAFWAWGNAAFDYDSDTDLDVFVCGGFYTGLSAKDT